MRPARWLLALLVVSAAYGFLQSPFWRVTQVDVHGVSALSAEEVVAWLDLPPEVRLWQVSPSRLQQRLLQHPRIEGARVVRRWPHRLEVWIQERRPVAWLRQEGQWLAVDADGRVIGSHQERPPESLLLEARLLAPLRVGDALPATLRPALQAAAFVRQYGLSWVEAVVPGPGPEEVELRLQHGVRAYLGSVQQQPERKLAVLAALWRRWEGQQEKLAEVDVSQPERPAVRLR